MFHDSIRAPSTPAQEEWNNIFVGEDGPDSSCNSPFPSIQAITLPTQPLLQEFTPLKYDFPTPASTPPTQAWPPESMTRRSHIMSQYDRSHPFTPPFVLVTNTIVANILDDFFGNFTNLGVFRSLYAYDVLNEINNLLCCGYGMCDSIVSSLLEVEKELIIVCLDYMCRWENDPQATAMLFQIQSAENMAQHYYQTCFAINTRRDAKLVSLDQKSWVEFSYLRYKVTGEGITFTMEEKQENRIRLLICRWEELPDYQRYLSFDRDAIRPFKLDMIGKDPIHTIGQEDTEE